MRWATFIVAIAAALVGGAGVAAARDRSAPAVAPRVAVFYYAWYGTPRLDGAWLHWSLGHNEPPQSLGSTYYPARGPYSSADRAPGSR